MPPTNVATPFFSHLLSLQGHAFGLGELGTTPGLPRLVVPWCHGAMVPWVGAEKLQNSGQLTQLTIQNADLFHDLTMKKP